MKLDDGIFFWSCRSLLWRAIRPMDSFSHFISVFVSLFQIGINEGPKKFLF